MTIELALSLLAMLVAVPSVLYARSASREASRANRIAVHEYKASILDAAQRFRDDFVINGEAFNLESLQELYGAAARAPRYLPELVAKELKRYASTAYELLIVRDRVNSYQAVGRPIPEATSAELFALVDKCKGLEREVFRHLEREVAIHE
jgi:hypothetical protein